MFSKYDLMAAEADRLWELAQATDDPELKEILEIQAANLSYDIENDEKD